ncbi:M15 family metallopeptidase [Roseibium suaedae]|uniref:D-alanyl-D-alanine carboxypeptidase n=1 Tax=Roseibium suaedae TaxID=735517 RepID=A0A1M7P9G1_9HYPH|nr:M15 family metallopeptidase [Roseibium suaedae]SHN13095.1 D-alanyl-D-alanine carboxypeptidase [Roseibium suaedae]
MRVLSALLIALAIASVPFAWHYAQRELAPVPPAAPVVDTSALEAEVAALREEVNQLQGRVDGLDIRTSLGLSRGNAEEQPVEETRAASDSLKDSFAQVVLIADRRAANEGFTVASPSFLQDLLGLPREGLTDDCQSATNPALKDLLKTENVGPIDARMLEPALVSLRQVFANVQVFEPELYARIKSAGSLCVRRIRGSITSASSHAYGLAVDINIDGVLDTLADGRTQLGLILLADFFKKEGWIWGAGFGREDSMHFEVSREKLLQWRRLGEI